MWSLFTYSTKIQVRFGPIIVWNIEPTQIEDLITSLALTSVRELFALIYATLVFQAFWLDA